MSWIHFFILVPILFSVFIPILYKIFPRIHTGWFVLSIPIVLFIYFLQQVPSVMNQEPVLHTLSWISSLGIDFSVYLDGLGLLFSLIITGIGSLVILYSIYYMSKEREALHNFYVYLMLFMSSMLGVVLSDNVIVLYVFWEITSISSFLLIAYWYQRKGSRYGAQKSMLITIFGGLSMLAGFLLLSIVTDTFSIQAMIGMREEIFHHSLFLPAMLLILLGAFTKSAQFPFHIWLPDAMEAPTPISAYLHSATMVKAGIYLVARFTPIFGGATEWMWAVSICGLVTLFWGSFLAVKQTDLKALLAYSTVSQLGMIMSLLGVGSMALYPGTEEASILLSTAILAALFHLINHATFKGSLFMIVGIIDLETGTRDIRRLGGLMSIMPISFTITVIGGLSMAGLPPFNGFLSKEMFFTGMLNAAESIGSWTTLFPYVAWLASVFTFVYSLIIILKTFAGSYQPEKLDKKPAEPPVGMLIPPIILASFVVVFFFFPNTLSYTVLEPAMQSILPFLLNTGEQFHVHITAFHGWNMELLMTIGVVLFGTILFFTLKKWSAIYDHLPEKLNINDLYNAGLSGMEKFSSKIIDLHMTGYVRDYLVYLFTFVIVLIGSSALHFQVFSFHFQGNGPIEIYEIVLVVVMVLAALYVILSTSRVMAVIAVGAVGYMLSLFFVILRAPDLALTQLVVETITTTLFALCLIYLPKLKKEISRVRVKVTNLLIAIGVGLIFTLIGLSVQGHRLLPPISHYFEDAYELAGAKNMVNAILVDFRGYDTMFEVIVLLIAGLGVFTLIKLRPTSREEKE
ncbi:Na+/H+ antiporter subunit A [Aliibacillus thermotolerans]|uniref:Na+/H+ antiporter subunit A n=1 Tax=Aliibacillus thermotolerans TaxID=1834418 RepID=A0ABW0UA69_9BACI|nr:Na+/H+ antiporter subunit A [Aliibacillus thermotolerans]MDA3131079.1 Na+/H+ antiporter subunit A [Aliibacillus thermotolerans]